MGLGTVILIIILIAGLGILIYNSTDNKYIKPIKNTITNLYQGPVPQGYDEKYFRETGKLKNIGG